MASRFNLIYWDSCIIIDLLEKRDSFRHIGPLVQSAMSGRSKIVVSSVSIAEVTRVAGLNPKEAQKAISQFFDQDYVELRAADYLTMRMAAEVRRTRSIETADAIHIATSMIHKCSVLLTRDGTSKKTSKTKNSILKLAPNFATKIRILTPEQYFCEIPSEFRQGEIDEQLNTPDASATPEDQKIESVNSVTTNSANPI